MSEPRTQQMQGKHFQQKNNPQHELQQNPESKCNKEQTKLNETQSGLTATTATPKKMNVLEMQNQDFVNHLLAATPPYFYSPAVGNHFFFSELLRGLVSARQSENMRQLQLQQQQQQQQQATLLARRSRKRIWSTQSRPYFDNTRECNELEEHKTQQPPSSGVKMIPPQGIPDKPLELSNMSYIHLANAYQRKIQLDCIRKDQDQSKIVLEQKENIKDLTFIENESNIGEPGTLARENAVVDNKLKNSPPQDIVLPTPPVWYPPLYPPCGFDPLHFFIDLRVSGHIYDRKKGSVSPLSNNADNRNLNNGESETQASCASTALSLPHKQRRGSAFSVPTPRSSELKNMGFSPDVLNLSANAAKYYDLAESKENNHPLSKTNSNEMLQQLPCMYSQFTAGTAISNDEHNPINENIDAGSIHNANRSDFDGGDSDGRESIDNSIGNLSSRDIDVELVDSNKYRTVLESSRCSSPDDNSITQID